MSEEPDTTCGSAPHSLLLQWHVTERCDHACTHCYQAGSITELPYESLLTILEQFRKLCDTLRAGTSRRIPAHITVTGGEPFLRDDLFDLLERFYDMRREFSFGILASGSRIDRESAYRLKLLGPGFVQVSLEGGKTTHDAIRGDGDFERVLAAVRHLKKAGVPVLISFSAHRGNFREFPVVAAIGRKLGVKRVWADRFVPLGGAAAQRDMTLSASETEEFLDILGAARSKPTLFPCSTEIAAHRALQFRVGGGRPYRCQAGRELITVMADGGLVPCRRLPIPAGNLLEANLADLYRDNPVFRELQRVDVPGGCSDCFYRRECRGGLRCLAHAMTGSFHRADPGCRVAKQA